MSGSYLDIRNLGFGYSSGSRSGGGEVREWILRNFSLEVPAGSFFLVKGRSGCGKTTLLNLIGGLMRPQEGSIMFEGRDLALASEAELAMFRSRRIGFIFQDANFDLNRTVLQNVMLPLYFSDIPIGEGRGRALELLEILGLGKLKNTCAACISGGQRQRAAAARALVTEPDIILADEPMSHLDAESSRSFLQAVDTLRRRRPTALIMTSHYLPEGMDAGQAVIINMDGTASVLSDETGNAGPERIAVQ